MAEQGGSQRNGSRSHFRFGANSVAHSLFTMEETSAGAAQADQANGNWRETTYYGETWDKDRWQGQSVE
jgi:hypothetical protein